MNIQATQVINIDIAVPQQRKIAIQFLFDKFNWSEEYSIKDGNVFWNKMQYGSHSFTDNILLREASELDYHVEAIYKNI
jgi:hypothetical protein